MIFESSKARLSVVKVSLKNEINDVYVCRDIRSSAKTLYTVIAVHDHTIVKQILNMLQETAYSKSDRIIDTFTSEGDFVMVFPYQQERLLDKFYMGKSYPITRCEDIAMNMLIACIGSHLPWSLLYLVLEQRRVNIASDDEIFLGYEIELADFDPDIGERNCVYSCAKIILDILEPQSSDKTISYQLLSRKVANSSYSRFSELYRDIRIAAVPKKKRGIIARLKNWFMRNRDRFFAILLRVSVVLAIIAILSLISQLIFGEVLWLAFLYNHFEIIGTENLAR